MDIYCLKCGEPWDIFSVQDDKTDFQFSEINTGKIIECPCCKGQTVDLSDKAKATLKCMYELADVLGEDIDGLASMYDDIECMGLFDIDE